VNQPVNRPSELESIAQKSDYFGVVVVSSSFDSTICFLLAETFFPAIGKVSFVDAGVAADEEFVPDSKVSRLFWIAPE